MVTYVMLMNLTRKGAAEVDGLPGYLQTLEGLVTTNGGTTLLACATLGAYDVVLAAELPDDGTAMNVAADIAKIGLTTVQTLKSFQFPAFETFWRGHQ
jgi:uncharacterized protein with GYD domain